MKGRLTREDARNVRVEVLLTANAADFAANVVATAKIAELTATNAAAAQERQNQIGGAGDVRQDYKAYADAFDAMVDDMETVRDFAIPIARKISGLEDKFCIPRTGGKSAKVAAAYVFVTDGEEIKQSFTDSGLDKNFFTNLKTKADAAQQGLNAAQTSTGNKSRRNQRIRNQRQNRQPNGRRFAPDSQLHVPRQPGKTSRMEPRRQSRKPHANTTAEETANGLIKADGRCKRFTQGLYRNSVRHFDRQTDSQCLCQIILPEAGK